MEQDNVTGKAIAPKSELLTEMEMLEIYGSMDCMAKINWSCKENTFCGKGENCYKKRRRRRKK